MATNSYVFDDVRLKLNVPTNFRHQLFLQTIKSAKPIIIITYGKDSNIMRIHAAAPLHISASVQSLVKENMSSTM